MPACRKLPGMNCPNAHIGQQHQQHDGQPETYGAAAKLEAEHEQRRSRRDVAGRQRREAGDPVGVARLIDVNQSAAAKDIAASSVVDRAEPPDARVRRRSQKADRQQQQEIDERLKLLRDGCDEREPADGEYGRDRQRCHQRAERARSAARAGSRRGARPDGRKRRASRLVRSPVYVAHQRLSRPHGGVSRFIAAGSSSRRTSRSRPAVFDSRP